MATAYPSELPDHIRRDPFRSAECKVYDALTAQLDDAFRVYYSRPWLGLNDDGSEIEGEADFVVAHADLGFLVIEVKGGRISHDATTDTWHSTDRFDSRQRIKDPVAQANKSKHRILTELKKRREINDVWVGAFEGVILPDCRRPEHQLGLEMPQEIMAFAEDMGSLDAWIRQRMKDSDEMSAAGSLGAQGLRILNELLARDFELESPLSVVVGDEEREILVLTGQQFRLLDLLENQQRCAVQGGAGTGKTLLAARKAELLAHEGLRTLLVCFNRPLADDLTRRLKPNTQLVVGSFHGVCGQMAKQTGVATTDVAGEQEFFDKALPEALVTAMEADPSLRFDAIVVDEAQDFLSEWWTALELALVDENSGTLYGFFDDNQALYSSDVTRLKGLFGEPYPLTENLRNTRAIYAEAQRFYRGVTNQCSGPRGRPVQLRRVDDPEDLLREVFEICAALTRSEGLNEDQVAVLADTSTSAKRISEALSRKYALHEAGVDPANVMIVDTVRRFKGLERPVVVLAGLSAMIDNPELAYVALSRARSHLVAIGSEDELGIIFGQT